MGGQTQQQIKHFIVRFGGGGMESRKRVLSVRFHKCRQF